MKWFLYLISFCLIASGSCFILYTIQCRELLKNMLSKSYEKIIAASAIIIGLLLIISAFQAQGFWFIVILGIIAIGKGFFVLFNPKNYFDHIKNWYLSTASDQTYRLLGIIIIVIGTSMITWI
ncbi:MAG: hypothetical protein JRE64_13830 [Deltaproteobacteria bacterium]|nr:hypothetical protein [Deltaproteobacteria bacterium]